MKIAITDTCIFIDLYDLELTETFFSLDVDVQTSLDVFLELYPEQQLVLREMEQNGVFHIHALSDEERGFIHEMDFARGLSETDKTVLFLAEKTGAMILSSYQLIRKQAKERAIERHGLLWVFDQLVEHAVLSKIQACTKLRQLISVNGMYQGNRKLEAELEKRFTEWEDHST